MARAALQKVYADFRQGFVTVANPLAYPEGSLKDIVNFDIKDNGTVRLRPGLQQESSVVVDTGTPYSELDRTAVSCFFWENVNNKGDSKIAIIQVGTHLYLYPVFRDRIAVESLIKKIDLEIPSEGTSIPISGTSGAGWFFIAHPSIRSKILKKDLYEEDYTVDDIDIKIRDLALWRGENDQQTGLEQGGSYTPVHAYNLRNGGWPKGCFVSNQSNADKGTSWRDPAKYTRQINGWYPPVYLPFHLGKAGGGDDLREQNAFSPWALATDYFGNSLIPLGRFIVSAERWSRRGEGETPFNPAVPASKTLERYYEWTAFPSNIEFYSGRVWYSGAEGYREFDASPETAYDKKDNLEVSNTIYFSQQLDSDMEKAGLCYQENDPTAEDLNSLLPTDGGTITVRGAGKILSMKTFGTSLIVFATQGVWAITGLDSNSFKADSYSVDKLSNIGPSSLNTIYSTDKDIFYLANDAVYMLTPNEISGKPSTLDITSARIKDFYNDIPYSQKQRAKTFFDEANRNLYILYSDIKDTASPLYNKVLVFNKDLGCFYKYELSSVDKNIFDGLYYSKDTISSIKKPVTLDGVPVTLDGTTVYLETTYSTDSANTLQLLTVEKISNGNIGVSFSAFSDTRKFEDWGQPYQGIIELGFDTAGDIMRDSIKAPVIISHLERTEEGFEVDPYDPNGTSLISKHPSSCYMTYGWDWANVYKGGTELYRLKRNYIPESLADPFEYGVDVVTSKNRIRGKGHSLGIRLTSGFGYDCRLLGIGILYTASNRL